MRAFEGILPVLELNFKTSIKSKDITRKKSRNILISPLYRINKINKINKIKAYSFFNSIKEKELRSKENNKIKNSPRNYNENKYKYKLLSVNYYNTKIKENAKNRDSIIISQLLDRIRKRVPIHINYFNYYTPGPGDYSPDKILTKNNSTLKGLFNDNLKLKSQLIEQKEKEKIYKKNIENKYSININRIKSYTRNKKLFINGLRKNPKYFKNNYKSYIKSISKRMSDSSDNINKSSSYLNISCLRNNNLDQKKLSSINLARDNSINNIFGNNNKYRLIKIKKDTQSIFNEFIKKAVNDKF